MGGPVAVVVVGVVVAAFGAEKECGQNEQAAASDQHGGEGEAAGVHAWLGDGLQPTSLIQAVKLMKDCVLGGTSPSG